LVVEAVSNEGQTRCLGCNVFVRLTKKSPVPACKRCREDKAKYNAIRWKWREVREQMNVDAEAEKATESLAKGPAFTPLTGEAAVLKMLRGEW
jgi:hypothetical protein